MSPTLRRGLLAVTLAGIAAVTLFPATGGAGAGSAQLYGLRLIAQVLANVVLFVPLGAAAALSLRGWIAPIATGAALSGAIELVQLGLAGRYSTPWDLVLNTAGTALGVALVRRREIALLPAAVKRRVSAAAALCGALALLVGSSSLFRPDLSPDLLFGQWTPPHGGGRYGGSVVSAKIGSMVVRSRSIANSAVLRSLLLDEAPIEVELIAGAAPAGVTPIFRIVDQHQREALLLAADGADLVYRYRMRSAAVGLRQPERRVAALFANARVGDRVTLSMQRRRGGWCAAVQARQRCGTGFRLAESWTLFAPPAGRTAAAVLSFAWIACLLVPTGWWLHRRDVLPAAFVTLILLAAAPLAVQVLPTSIADYLAALVGLALGHALGAAFRTRGRKGDERPESERTPVPR